MFQEKEKKNTKIEKIKLKIMKKKIITDEEKCRHCRFILLSLFGRKPSKEECELCKRKRDEKVTKKIGE
jgi:hypothetical protein